MQPNTRALSFKAKTTVNRERETSNAALRQAKAAARAVRHATRRGPGKELQADTGTCRSAAWGGEGVGDVPL